MKLKLFQKQDLARAALHDDLILSWDTGLGKTWALFLWPLLKCGYVKFRENGAFRVRPNRPILIVAPGDLHAQITQEGWNHFKVRVVPLTSQDDFGRIVQHTTLEGRPVIASEFYIVSYTQLTTNGVQALPDPFKYKDPRQLLEELALPIGDPVPSPDGEASWEKRPEFTSVCHFWAWRGLKFADEYHRLQLDPNDTSRDLAAAYAREREVIAAIRDPKLRSQELAKLEHAHGILKNLFTPRAGVGFAGLAHEQQDFVLRHFLDERINRYAAGDGLAKVYAQGELPEGYDPEKPETDTRVKRVVRCVYSPSLADLSWNAFDCVVIDEGVKMKGEDTLVGRGIRLLAPAFRLVLTATPVKNRLPDIFRLAWWATGGKREAHARWPYRDDSAEREKFAQTFMVSERNLTREAKAAAEKAAARGARISGGFDFVPEKKEGNPRYSKLTAEVCNIHRLWKLLGPTVLRRRKQDTGEDIVPKIRKVIRCEMGTLQRKVYQYHLDAEYRDINREVAIGAQLQALRMAAADPASEHLRPQGGEPVEDCGCGQSPTDDPPKQPVCPKCQGRGKVRLPVRSGQSYIPKAATTLTLIEEILARREQVVVFSAFNDPLDNLSAWLTEAGVRHIQLDGRVSQQARGKQAALFKHGRFAESGTRNSELGTTSAVPVMLAGVECMAEGHSFHLANNVILIAYSWAYDKFKQALDRVHRMNSAKPVNVYVVVCTGSIDLKLESLVNDKGDASELVLDGRLIGERTEEVNLAELLRVAHREFNPKDKTLDEALLHRQWPALRERLRAAMNAWTDGAPVLDLNPQPINPQLTARKPVRLMKNKTTTATTATSIPVPSQAPTPEIPIPVLVAAQASAPPAEDWRARVQRRAALLQRAARADVWANL